VPDTVPLKLNVLYRTILELCRKIVYYGSKSIGSLLFSVIGLLDQYGRVIAA